MYQYLTRWNRYLDRFGNSESKINWPFLIVTNRFSIKELKSQKKYQKKKKFHISPNVVLNKNKYFKTKAIFAGFSDSLCKIKVHFLKAISWNILTWLPDTKQCNYFLPEISSNGNIPSLKLQCRILSWFRLHGLTFCKLIVWSSIFL